MNPCETHLLRQLADPPAATLWIVDENIADTLIAQIPPNPSLTAITNRIDIGYQLEARHITAIINDFDFSELTTFDNVIYRVSKERSLAQHCIIESHSRLNRGGELLLLGEKHDGIKTQAQFAEQVFVDSMRWEKQGLCYLAHFRKIQNQPSLDSSKDTYADLQEIQQDGMTFYSKPGVYGWKKIDQGSRLLIDTIEPRLKAQDTKNLSLLDLGCGYGYLILQLAQFGFKKLYATDNNVAAITAARKNFSEQNLSVQLSLDDCAKKLDDKIDIIICNPPFHQGFSHDKALTLEFVQRSLKLLSAGGQAYFVVNDFIALPKAVAQAGGKWELLAQQRGFKVYRISH
jgi:16S rRNA (guanine1207-N2)-methyltransferase